MEIARETNAASLTDTPLDLYSARRTAEHLHMQNNIHVRIAHSSGQPQAHYVTEHESERLDTKTHNHVQWIEQ